jgi:hypothetical protein
MSGGHFEYDQYRINTIHDSIESYLLKQGKPKYKSELYAGDDYYAQYPEEKCYPVLRKDIEEKFKKALVILKQASIYAQRIDWYLSGDDGEDTFIERLEKELKQLSDDTNRP